MTGGCAAHRGDMTFAPPWACDPKGRRSEKTALPVPVKLMRCVKCKIKVVATERFNHVLRCPQMDLQALFESVG